ncbi:MAG: aquaporin [Gammaproteobacteria bacterium]|nr:aquaporin [Gammaproteobacteria bacterium]
MLAAGFPELGIGLALALIHLVSIPVTNTSVNPARSPRNRACAVPLASAGSARRVHVREGETWISFQAIDCIH